MNSTQLVGRLTKNVEMKTTNSGKEFAQFTVAVDNPFKRDDASFIPCVAWGKTAEFVSKYFSKGQRIGVTGNLKSGSYEKDGQKHYTLDLIVQSAEFVESKNTSNSSDQATASNDFMKVPEGAEEEMPF